MNSSTRHAVAAVRAFAETTQAAYGRNLELFRAATGPADLHGLTPFAAETLTAAQSYTDAKGPGFILLAHLEGSNVDFAEMEGLVWLANDALVFDASVKALAQGGNDQRLLGLAVLHGERALARAIYLQALLGGCLRAMDCDLFAQAASQAPGAAALAERLSEESVRDFTQRLEPVLPEISFKQEIVAFAHAMGFPNMPLVIGHTDEGREVLNGVVMSSGLAQQMRDHFSRTQAPR